MGLIRELGRRAWRKYFDDGVSSTGFNQPSTIDIFPFVDAVDSALSSLVEGLVIGGAVVYSTRAALYADLAHDVDTLGVIYADGTAAYNGVYVKSGASGTGAWTITSLALPATFAADLAAEITNRETDVANLQDNIDIEAIARSGADTLLDALIDNEAFDRTAADEVRALISSVPGTPALSPDMALQLLNVRNGALVAAITASGEIIAPGKPVLDALLGAMRTSVNGFVIDAIRHDGSVDVVDRNLRPLLDARYSGVRLDAGGGIVEGQRRDGAVETAGLGIAASLGHFASYGDLATKTVHGVDIEAEAYDAWIRDGQVWADVMGRVVQLTDSIAHDFVAARIQGGQLSLRRGDDLRVTTPLRGSYPPLDQAVKVLEYGDLYGQSAGAGNAATALTTQPFSARALMFAGGQRAYGNALGHSQERTRPQQAAYDAIHDFAYACETFVDGAGETANSGFAGLLLSSLDADTALLTTCSAVGSANIGMLLREALENTEVCNTIGDPWRNLESKFIRAALFWRLQGFDFLAGPLRYNQGEGDINAAKAIYLGYLAVLRDDWQALAAEWNALRPDGPRVGIAPLMTTQTCSGAHYGYIRSEVPSAQLQINLDDPSTALCIGPIYDQVYAADGVHPDALGQEMQGARQAVAERTWLSGTDWYPLHVRKDFGFAPARTGTTVRLRIRNVLGRTLTFDTTTITGLGLDQGFRWADNGDGNAVTVVSAAIIDSTTVDLFLSGTPTGTGGRIEIAMTGADGAPSGPTTGNRATLRTTGGADMTLSGRPVEHFISIDSVPVV